ncbi:MAG: GntR family transcriptional regulator [Rubrivivax sp.]
MTSRSTGTGPVRTPLYRSVKQQITEALREGRWKHGQKIASEPQLARRFKASVGTIRKAVGELVAENILVREQGRGTFVRTHGRDYMLSVFFRIVGHDGAHELPEVTLLSMKRARADRATAQLLRLKPRAPVFDIETLLALDGQPAILDRMRVPVQMFPDLTHSGFARREGTVYGFFQDRYGITIVRAQEFITAVAADARTAQLLHLPPGAPLLRIARTSYTYKDVPVDTRVRWVSCARHGYLSQLGKT